MTADLDLASRPHLPRGGRLSELLRTPRRACACPGPTPQPSPEKRFSESVTSPLGGFGSLIRTFVPSGWTRNHSQFAPLPPEYEPLPFS